MEKEQTKQVEKQEKRKLNIYEKMLLISTKLQTVAKNLEVQVTKTGKYKAVGEADVLRAIKPLELEFKVFSYPVGREIIESGTLESTDYNGNVKKQLFERIKVVYRFINTENPTEYVDITSYGDGIDSGDKSVGKAMTYADKYALLKAYKIVTGDDPDQEASEELSKAEIKKPGLSVGVIELATEAGVDLEKLAVYLKKKPADLTDKEVEAAANRKLGAKKNA